MPDHMKDVVCGVMVDPARGRHEKLNDRDYCFCSEECRFRFIVNPGRYLAR